MESLYHQQRVKIKELNVPPLRSSMNTIRISLHAHLFIFWNATRRCWRRRSQRSSSNSTTTTTTTIQQRLTEGTRSSRCISSSRVQAALSRSRRRDVAAHVQNARNTASASASVDVAASFIESEMPSEKRVRVKRWPALLPSLLLLLVLLLLMMMTTRTDDDCSDFPKVKPKQKQPKPSQSSNNFCVGAWQANSSANWAQS